MPNLKLAKKHKCFNEKYYIAQGPCLNQNGFDAWQHYISEGWRKGLNPSSKFNTQYYLEENPDVAAAGINPLIHYMEYGIAEGRTPAPVMFTGNKKLNSGLGNVEHPSAVILQRLPQETFVSGWFFDKDGRPARKVVVKIGKRIIECQSILRPDVCAEFAKQIEVAINCGFDCRFKTGRGIKRIIIEVENHNGNLFELRNQLVWMNFTKAHNSSTLDNCTSGKFDEYLSRKIQPSELKTEFPVAVIIPIYRDAAMTKTCIVKAMPEIMRNSAHRLIAINDCSPEAEMDSMLQSLENKWPGQFIYSRNEKNLGFVQTVNKGISIAAGSDVVLLNSDVYLANSWLQRIQLEAYSSPKVGTVTPLSNNATICSFPRFDAENQLFLGKSEGFVDAVFSKRRLPNVKAPTGVGFCMYIRADCIKEIGFLNADEFGRGYGEENDLCQRAQLSGWENLITANVYARHLGSVSFSSDKAPLVDQAQKTLCRLHPNYHKDVRSFMQRDELKLPRLARMMDVISNCQMPVICAISHRLGGGTKQHIEELSHHLRGKAHIVLIEPAETNGCICLYLDFTSTADAISYSVDAEWDLLIGHLRLLNVSLIHYHHTYKVPDELHSIHKAINVPHVVTVHDFYWIGGNPTLTRADHIYAGTALSAPLGNHLFPFPKKHTGASWRNQHRPLLEEAEEVIFPSHAARDIFGDLYKVKSAKVVYHPEEQRAAPNTRVKALGPSIKWCVLGALSQEKGADFLEKLALNSKAKKLPWEFKLIGYPYRMLQGVKSTGIYKQCDLPSLIEEHKVEAFLFTARWPETYSYTLSAAISTGLPIVAPSVGSFPERLAGYNNSCLYDIHEEPVQVIKLMVDFAANFTARTKPSSPPSIRQSDYYKTAYMEIASRKCGI